MRLGLISDIHADLDGLRRALELLDKLGADRILCAGDLVERGEGGDAVIDLLRGRCIPCVKGNHEYVAVHKHQAMARSGEPDGLGFRPLQPESLGYIQALPDTQRFELEGRSLLLAHATPWDDFTFVFPASRPALFQRVATAAQADILILGHTHIAMLAEVGGVLIANPGSVSAAGSRTCALFSLPDRELEVYSIDNGEPVADFARITL